MEGDGLHWYTDHFTGFGWHTQDDTIMHELDRLGLFGADYMKLISIVSDGQGYVWTWQGFKDGRPWKRTLRDKTRIEP